MDGCCRKSEFFTDPCIVEPSHILPMEKRVKYGYRMAGLKYLGIIHDQAKVVCSEFLSSQLADHMHTHR